MADEYAGCMMDLGVLDILVVHRTRNVRTLTSDRIERICAFDRHAIGHRTFHYNALWPQIADVTNHPWSLIVFTETCFPSGGSNPRQEYEDFAKAVQWIAAHNAHKIALIDNEYFCTSLLDDWLLKFKINTVCGARPELASAILKKTAKKAEFHSTHSNNREFELSQRHELPTAIENSTSRQIDIAGQSSYDDQAVDGSLTGYAGLFESEFLHAMKAGAISRNLREEIHVTPNARLQGEEERELLRNSRFYAACEQCLGIADPKGAAHQRLLDARSQAPSADLSSLDATYLDGASREDLRFGLPFSIHKAIEAGCCLVLREGDYEGHLQPGEHYIEVKSDFSNLRTVFSNMKDEDDCARLVANCNRDFATSSDELNRRFALDVVALAKANIGPRTVSQNADLVFDHLVATYQREVATALLNSVESTSATRQSKLGSIAQTIPAQYVPTNAELTHGSEFTNSPKDINLWLNDLENAALSERLAQANNATAKLDEQINNVVKELDNQTTISIAELQNQLNNASEDAEKLRARTDQLEEANALLMSRFNEIRNLLPLRILRYIKRKVAALRNR